MPREPPWIKLDRTLFSDLSGAEGTEAQSPRVAERARRKKKQRMWLYNEVRASSPRMSQAQ